MVVVPIRLVMALAWVITGLMCEFPVQTFESLKLVVGESRSLEGLAVNAASGSRDIIASFSGLTVGGGGIFVAALLGLFIVDVILSGGSRGKTSVQVLSVGRWQMPAYLTLFTLAAVISLLMFSFGGDIGDTQNSQLDPAEVSKVEHSKGVLFWLGVVSLCLIGFAKFIHLCRER